MNYYMLPQSIQVALSALRGYSHIGRTIYTMSIGIDLARMGWSAYVPVSL